MVRLEFPPPEKGTFVQAAGPPAVSPDGRRVVFRFRANDGKAMLWVRDLDQMHARMLPGTDAPATPFWAPDSRQIGFVSSGKLMKIDVTGGPAVTLANASGLFRGGTWNQDDVIVYSPEPTSVLVRLSAGGGTPAPVTELDTSRNEVGHRYPHFLPDGRHFLYLAVSSDPAKTAVFVGDLESKDKKLIGQIGSNVDM